MPGATKNVIHSCRQLPHRIRTQGVGKVGFRGLVGSVG